MNLQAVDTIGHIEGVCHQFSETTGWPLHFHALGNESLRILEQHFQQTEGVCWVRTLQTEQQPLGILALFLPEHSQRDKFFEPVRRLAECLADLFCKLASATECMVARDRDVDTFVNLGLKSRTELALSDNLESLLKAAIELTGFESAGFYLLSPSTNRLKLRAHARINPETMPAINRELAASPHDLQALNHGYAIVQRISMSDDRWLPEDATSGLCVSVQSATVPLGTLWVYGRHDHSQYLRELEVLKAVAAHLATALERVVLLRESDSQYRLACELRVVNEVQAANVPEPLPVECGFKHSARCVSRHEVGGDLLELISLTEQTTGIAVGDASGKSIPAALVMSMVRGALRSCSGRRGAHEWHPVVTMERINRSLHACSGSHQFMTLFYGVYDSSMRQLTYTNAGHPPPILYRGNKCDLLPSHGLFLGIEPDYLYEFSVLDTLPGDLLVLYSDGISEAMNAEGVLFKDEGIMSVVEKYGDEPEEEILHRIWSAAEKHGANAKQKNLDDRTLLVIRFD